ncbi:MAG TPA: UDP-N-acetylglucosamine 1-carboxyvinyltransferase [Nitrospira sp.]|jgi:UDP-N-acetylglucosamine 1-carboxyvinyltransferase|nr:UDP-N-acetylglucosamine 1-carboxyvinyltransferase [Nitrospira sp.]HMZ54602.1 UDP-N-acetylglucosamine 1-carboxyvinyltransferase [Nitrospira sp.]HNK14495.1 UDP-N-acetylglucosamine 1-carboxyvinyltransferase [Nitrospira sp.]HNL89856.1 UDP-N-acetylglucosamine 1-carboxyvinyltransferase [Nitrospira sp.]HUM40899.1 UDP-N-acetylglucosamine 1-carboxyvinyltransferase [Nitrospira sp.]
MDQIIIHGGRRLKGEVRTSGAKNAALPILASTILGGGECVLSNMPSVVDVLTMGKLLRMLGIAVAQEGEHTVVDAQIIASTEAPYDLVRTMRASVLVLGPLVARMGEAKVSLPGGCAIGSRPVNFHLAGLEKMGATVEIEHGYIKATARRLRGSRIYFDTPSVTGTENLMMAAVLAEGTTVLENAAKEPEISDLAAFLVKRGARIAGAGTDMIMIEGVTELHGADHDVIPDRIEAGTYLVAGAITGGEISVKRCRPEHMEPLLVKLRESGVELAEEGDRVHLKVTGRLKGTNVRTSPHPGFPTDMQAQFVALMAVAEGTSVVTETIFESRFMHVEELRRMGAEIRVEGNRVVITGREGLTGAPVMASDLRASAGLIVAGLAAEGITEVSRVYHLDRGYERLEDKLKALGASIERRKGK